VTFDSVAAVQTRIAQIQQLISGSAAGVGGSRAPAATSTQSPEFASLLADAMGTGTSTDPLSGLSAPSTDASGTATGATSMVSQLRKHSQLASNPTGTSTATASNATTQLFHFGHEPRISATSRPTDTSRSASVTACTRSKLVAMPTAPTSSTTRAAVASTSPA
jgi:hypothetical protein